MKIIEGYKMRQLGREHIVVGEGLAQIDLNKMVSLNDTAAYLWESVKGREFTVEDLTDLLLERYEVDRPTADADCRKLAAQWIEAGLVSE